MAAALAAAGIGVAGGQLGTSWAPALLLDFNPANLLALPHHIFWLFTGFFLLGEAWAAPIPVAAVALVATATLFGVFVYFGRDLQKAGDRTDLLVALSPLLALAPAVVLEEVLPRYLLSVTVFMFVAIAHGVGRHRPSLGGREVTALGVLLLVLVVAATQTSRLRTHAVGTGSDVEEELRALVETLRVNGVEAVYATDGLLQWQIAFYGREFVPVRSRRAVDRVPAYVAGVDSVARSGGRTAMVAPVDQVIRDATGALPPGLHAVGTDYVVLPDPNPTLLTLLGFEIPR